MTNDPQKQPRTIRLITIIVLVLVCVYAATYWSLVTPGLTYRGGKVGQGPIYANHRGVQRALDRLFWPVHQIDRIIRPSVWQVEFSDVPMMRAM